jgi:hypothetical protein
VQCCDGRRRDAPVVEAEQLIFICATDEGSSLIGPGWRRGAHFFIRREHVRVTEHGEHVIELRITHDEWAEMSNVSDGMRGMSKESSEFLGELRAVVR